MSRPFSMARKTSFGLMTEGLCPSKNCDGDNSVSKAVSEESREVELFVTLASCPVS